MDNEMITKTATSLQLERIADAIEEILRLVKKDQEDAKKTMLAAADEGLKEYNE